MDIVSSQMMIFLRMTILLLLTGMMTIISTFSSEDSRRIAYKALSREPETSKKKKKN